jgi:hypothetical protein
MHDVAMRGRLAALVIAAAVAVLLVGGAMLFGMGKPADAATGGNSANAHKCAQGGHLDYTDAQGNPFKNAGHCTRYAARGGQLLPGPGSTADITLDQAAGSISGTGFTPNSPITLRRVYLPGPSDNTDTDWQTDATGAFNTGDAFDFCFDLANTSVVVTATDGEGVTVTRSFPLSC